MLVALALLCAVAWGGERNAGVGPCPPPPGAVASGDYSLTVGSTAVFVQAFKDVHYAQLAFTGACDVAIHLAEPVGTWSLSPRRYGIQAKARGRELRFRLDRPRHLVVQANGLPRLFLFAERPEKTPPQPGQAGVMVATDAGIDGAGRAVQTKAIQAAIDALADGQTLFFPQGVYRTGSLALKSRTTLYLAAGALLQGSTDPKDYPPHPNDGKKTSPRLILVDGAQNVRIAGRGAVDAAGTVLRTEHGHRGRVLLVRNSRDVTIEGLVLRDPPSWNTHIVGSRRVTLRNVKLLNNPGVKNTDGFDPDASSHVLIENCFAWCGDDAVAVKSAGYDGINRDVEAVTVRGCVFLTRKSALKIGTESRTARFRDIAFEGNDVLLCDRGMTLYCYDGATYENIRFVDNRFEQCYPDIKQRLADFAIRNRGGRGCIRNVLIRNCSADRPWPQPSTLRGLDAEHTIRGVRFENFRIAGTVCRSAEEARLLVGKHVDRVTFSPAPGEGDRRP